MLEDLEYEVEDEDRPVPTADQAWDEDGNEIPVPAEDFTHEDDD